MHEMRILKWSENYYAKSEKQGHGPYAIWVKAAPGTLLTNWGPPVSLCEIQHTRITQAMNNINTRTKIPVAETGCAIHPPVGIWCICFINRLDK